MEIQVLPPEFPARSEIAAVASAAMRELELDASLRELCLAFDAPEFEGAGYWEVERREEGFRATLYGSPRDVLTPPGVGEDRERDIDLDRLDEIPDLRVDRLRLDRWLHRNLLQLDDLICRRVRPAELPSEATAGFQACWDVWTDGRLRRWQQPGLSQAERRRVFFRVFARQGLLLPRHWAVFHGLWAGEHADQEGLLRALTLLPSP